MTNRRGPKRGPITELFAYLPPEGCLIFFNSDEITIRRAASIWQDVVEVHKINGEFLNHSRRDLPVDMYVCLKGSLDDA